MYRRLLALCAMLILTSFAAYADSGSVGTPTPAPFWGYQDTYQLDVVQNLTTNDAVINLANAGAYALPAINTGYLCANIYVFGTNVGNTVDLDYEQMAACCACPISRNGSRNIRARELVSNPFPTGPINAATIKIVWTRPATDTAAGCFGPQNSPLPLPTGNVIAPLPGPGVGFATGGRAWATHWHVGLPSTPAFGTETQFTSAPLSAAEASLLSNSCTAIWTQFGSGLGRCPAQCGRGGAAAPTSTL